jgi:hypothetical protein
MIPFPETGKCLTLCDPFDEHGYSARRFGICAFAFLALGLCVMWPARADECVCDPWWFNDTLICPPTTQMSSSGQ